MQSYPHLLEVLYTATDRFLQLFRCWLKRGGWVERLLIQTERLTKDPSSTAGCAASACFTAPV